MFRNLITKGLYDKRWFMLGWSLGVSAMVAILLAFFPTLKQGDTVEQLFKNIPASLQGLIGSIDSYRTVGGYIGTQGLEIRIPLLTLIMAIVLGINIGVGEESTGRLYQLLAQPISRRKVLFEKWLTLVLVFAVIHLALLISLLVSVALLHETVSTTRVMLAVLMCFLFTLTIGTISYALGMATGKRSAAITAGACVAFGGYLVSSFALQISWLKIVDKFSPMHYYKPADVIRSSFSPLHALVFVATCVVFVVLASVVFERRDIGIS